jgi:hypothetical protein
MTEAPNTPTDDTRSDVGAPVDLVAYDAMLSERFGGEPFFTLRGQDAFAPALITAWAMLAADHGCPPDKVTAAFEVAKTMHKWSPRKFPD